MTYLQHKELKPEDFKRFCGGHKETFAGMVSVIQEQVAQKNRKLGKPSKLSVEDQVLISLEDSRE
jgi:predicted transcriptional regulator